MKEQGKAQRPCRKYSRFEGNDATVDMKLTAVNTKVNNPEVGTLGHILVTALSLPFFSIPSVFSSFIYTFTAWPVAEI